MKKRISSAIFSIFFLAVLFVLAPNIKAEAAEIKQSATTRNSVTISWDDPYSGYSYYKTTAYRVYVGTIDANYNYNYVLYETLPASQRSIQINNLPAGCERKIKIEYDYISEYSSTPHTLYMGEYIRTLPGKVTGLRQARWYYWMKSFDATWDEQTGVDGYQYIVKTNKNKTKASGTAKYSNSFSVDKISNSVVYSGRVRAYSTINGVKYYGPWSDTAYFMTQPQITKAKISGNKLSVKWKKVGGATGYDVYVSTKKASGYKKVKSVSSRTTSATIKKLGTKKFSKKKTYYVYIVTKKTVKGRTSKSGRLYYWNTKNNSKVGYF